MNEKTDIESVIRAEVERVKAENELLRFANAALQEKLDSANYPGTTLSVHEIDFTAEEIASADPVAKSHRPSGRSLLGSTLEPSSGLQENAADVAEAVKLLRAFSCDVIASYSLAHSYDLKKIAYAIDLLLEHPH